MSTHTDIVVAQPEPVRIFFNRVSTTVSPDDAKYLREYVDANPESTRQLCFILNNSKFVRETLSAQPEILLNILRSRAAREPKLHIETLDGNIFESSDDLDRALRQRRKRVMIDIIWRDFNRLLSLEHTTAALSQLARLSLDTALRFHYRTLTEKFGTPRDAQGIAQPFLILGMGKLGAGELNLSSDIDLIFAFPENGKTDHPSAALSNQEFFSHLGKRIIQSLDRQTADGYVFRVDMRLRPYGQSGALVYSFAALEEYYQNQGREWERYAMVKASVVAGNGDAEIGERLMTILRRFTYRKYIDFSVIDALRNLKRMITQEVKRRGLGDDIKLGTGGIRELEFVTQVFQLIRGGREAELQQPQILKILPLLAAGQYLPADTVERLVEAYIFLRNTEHAIQGYADQQTQKLPVDDEERRALTAVMGFADWISFSDALEQHKQQVREVFTSVIAEPEQKTDSDDTQIWTPLWHQSLPTEQAIRQLGEAGFEKARDSLALLTEVHTWADASGMHGTSRERLDQFMPMLLMQLANRPKPDETLRRCSQLVKAVARRSAYLLLLIENPAALAQLLRLSEASPWIADCLAEHPALLDELLDPRSLYLPPQRIELESELTRTTLRIAADDLEAQMEALRHFRLAHGLRVAASEISHTLPLMKVSDYLTWIAEVILDHVLRLCWSDMVKRYGYPDGDERVIPKFIIVGYGKLGGIELGHGSDLDLVFIHDADPNGVSNGERSIDNQTFFTRLGQKIIHFLTTRMSSGELYTVDMRLRPSGNSGMLVTSIDSFIRYQRDSAWTWEHQALVRARAIAGDHALAERLRDIRSEILCKKRDEDRLREDVIAMRQKMREHLSNPKSAAQFDLKHDDGGIVDIEFMVQYGVLAWANSHPDLVTFTDNIRILASFADAGLLDTQEVNQLTEAYKAFRAAGHRLTLQQQPTLIDAQQLADERRSVREIWQRVMDTQKT